MKKYKLIKEYPGSPKLQTIEKQHNIITTYDGYPEFWEEVIEKDYEILSYYENKNIFTIEDNSEILERLGFKIHSVKRLSDGEIFTIGDKYKWKRNSKYNKIKTICLILLEDEEILIHDSNNISDEYDSHLNSIIKIKQVLFTTEDGVEIYPDMYVWRATDTNGKFFDKIEDEGIFTGHWEIYEQNYKCKGSLSNHKHFSTKEKAEEYILINKPCLSIKEIAPIFGQMHLDNSKTVLDRMTEKLVNLVKSKL